MGGGLFLRQTRLFLKFYIGLFTGCFLDNIIGLVTRIVKRDTLDSLALFFKAYLKLFGKWYNFYLKLFKNN